MEQEKDTQREQRQSNIPLSNKRQHVQQNINPIILIHKRAERIVAALFLVTDILSSDNPIRHRMRLLGVDLLSFIVSSPQSVQPGNLDDVFFRAYMSRLLEISSLFEVAYLSEQISEMNFSVMKGEIERLISTAERTKKQTDTFAQLSKIGAVFSGGLTKEKREEISMSLSNKLRQQIFNKGHQATRNRQRPRRRVSYSPADAVVGKGNHDDGIDKQKRKDVIVRTLSDGKHLTIKDIAIVLNDIGEKTIQRELSFMVSTGVLKREGERRWSKYYLA